MRRSLRLLLRGQIVPPLLIDLGIPVLTAAVAYRFATLDWTIGYTLLSFIISLIFHLHIKIANLPRNIVGHNVFRTLSIAYDMFRIMELDDPLFIEVAVDKTRELQSILRRLKHEEYVAIGEEVSNIYSKLISELKEADVYLATTYINDAFWETEVGEKFFKCNEEALRRGAKITRVFLYNSVEVTNVYSAPVVQRHIKLKCDLGERLGSNLSLFTFDLLKADRHIHVAEDKGILRDTYVMYLHGDPRNPWRDATISIDKDTVEHEKVRFKKLLEHGFLNNLNEKASENLITTSSPSGEVDGTPNP